VPGNVCPMDDLTFDQVLGLLAFPHPDGTAEVVDLAEFAAMSARVEELFAHGRPVTPADMRAVRDRLAAEQQP
jgi:hypothetical protein